MSRGPAMNGDERPRIYGTTLRMPIIECIPNVSEGRRPEVVERIADAIRAVPGVRLLDYSSDASHNRSVFTLAGDAAAAQGGRAGAVRARRVAPIDLRAAPGRASAARRRRRRAVRPDRRGDDGGLRRAGEGRRRRRWPTRFGVPVYLYEEASANPAAQEPRRHPPRRVRGARGEDGAAGLGAGLRARRAARVRRRDRSSARACRSSPTTST